MSSTSTVSLYSHPQVIKSHSPHSLRSRFLSGSGVLLFAPAAVSVVLVGSARKCGVRFRGLVVRVAASSMADGRGSRRAASGQRVVYRESQAEPAPSPLKQVASVVAPAGVFLAVTFVLWKLVEKLLIPKPERTASMENKSPPQGMNWSFAVGTNLLPGLKAKIDRESKQKLNEFAKELRTFRSVDMSGRNFGDEGLFFLSESLGYNQTVEEVSFAANGITAEGIKAFDGVLQSNIVLKTLDLSGNPIGDEGIKIEYWKGTCSNSIRRRF